MSIKQVIQPFQVFSSISVSGTTVVISSVTNILYRDSIAYQFTWSPLVQGTFDIQGSVDYSPGLPQFGQPNNPGTWTSISLTPAPTATGSGGSQNVLINMNQLSFAWIRAQFTSSSGSGVITGNICGKSLG